MIETLHDVRIAAGPQAEALLLLWRILLAACAVVFIAIMAALAAALWRAPRVTERTAADVASHPRIDATMRRWINAAVAVSTVLLFGLLVASFLTDRAIARLPLDGAVHIDLTAHQYWWEARYDAHDPGLAFYTANELHVPVGRPVLLRLRADDVIHSFWVPSLTGKKDLIPGRESTIAFRADHAGVYRGQCAEFCGYQHAHMALLVVADEPAAFEQWQLAQRALAPVPRTDDERRGYALVTGTTCAMCHAIGGTPAQGRRAPDLTHVASRTTLAAGTLPNTRAAMVAWVADPQTLKPGVNMPPNDLEPRDLVAIAAYLGSLR